MTATDLAAFVTAGEHALVEAMMDRCENWLTCCGMLQLLDDCLAGRYSVRMLASVRKNIEDLCVNNIGPDRSGDHQA